MHFVGILQNSFKFIHVNMLWHLTSLKLNKIEVTYGGTFNDRDIFNVICWCKNNNNSKIMLVYTYAQSLFAFRFELIRNVAFS